MAAMQESALALQLKGYRLATAEITYHMPDHPGLLQSFLWQHLDLAPEYPRLHQFLDYWRQHIEAVLHSVKVGRVELISPARVKHARAAFLLH
jgi:uncharacterized protein Usg